MIGRGLSLNDTGFILVQATCLTSSLSRSVTLFPSPGARSLLWGYKREGIRWGARGPVGLWTEGPRETGAPTCAKYLSVCSVRIVGSSIRWCLNRLSCVRSIRRPFGKSASSFINKEDGLTSFKRDIERVCALVLLPTLSGTRPQYC